MIAERDDGSLDELAVLCIEKQAVIQAALEILAMVCCGEEEEQEQVSTLLIYKSTVGMINCVVKDFRSSNGYKQHSQ